MQQTFDTLRAIGLSENEARVYVAGLSLGPSTAQHLAAKALVSRPNTYIMIETLIKRGLMTSFEKGKKRYFAAESPDKMYRLLERELESLENRKSLVASVLPALRTLGVNAKAPAASVADDAESFRTLLEDFVAAVPKGKPALVTSNVAPKALAMLADRGVKITTVAADSDAAFVVAGESVLMLDLNAPAFGVILTNSNVADGIRGLLSRPSKSAASAERRRANENAMA